MRTIVATAVLIVAAMLSFVLRRRKSDAPAQVRGEVPHQLNLKDFEVEQKKWLVAVFTSSTCERVVMLQPRHVYLKAPKSPLASSTFWTIVIYTSVIKLTLCRQP
ncbi:MAG: hypothetical protein EBQ54_05440 [Actinobacteria bacterium]|nr:hypothetical protein [Actinomycetota bacterium]